MALLLAVLGVVPGLVVASSLLLRWNKVRYSWWRGLPLGTVGWPLFSETTEFLKQAASWRAGDSGWLANLHDMAFRIWMPFPSPFLKGKAVLVLVLFLEQSTTRCSVYVPSFAQTKTQKKKKHTLAGWLMIHWMSSIIERKEAVVRCRQGFKNRHSP
jgi:hypothetical protein